MKLRLNGWQRLGVVATAGWVLWAAFMVVREAQSGWGLKWGDALFIMALIFVLPAVTWGAVYGAIYLVRWVRAGFRP